MDVATATELEMSYVLVESFASDFTPEQFADDYQVQLRELIEAKSRHGDAVDTEATFGEEPEAEGQGEVLDLMEACGAVPNGIVPRRAARRRGPPSRNPR